MGGTIWLIEKVIKDPNKKIVALAEVLDKKEGLLKFWGSPSGKLVLDSLQSDSRSIWVKLESFEWMSNDEIRSHLAQIRANTRTLSTLRGSSNVEEIQEMLDTAVKQQAENERRR